MGGVEEELKMHIAQLQRVYYVQNELLMKERMKREKITARMLQMRAETLHSFLKSIGSRSQETASKLQTFHIFFFCSSVLSSLANRIMIFFSSLDTLRGISDALAWLMHCCCLFSTLRSFSLDFFPTHTYPNMVHIFSCLSLLGMK